MIGHKESQLVYRLPPHYIKMLTDSVVSKRSRRSILPVVGDKISSERKTKAGITLIGSRMGQGKTSTINIFIDAFEKDESLSGIQIAYLHTLQINASKSNFVDEATKLMINHKPEKLVVVIDQIDCYESMKAGILLANLGYTVVGLVCVQSDTHITNILSSAVKGIPSQYEAMLAYTQLIEHLNALFMQDQNYPMRVKHLEISKNDSKAFVKIFKKHGLSYLYEEVMEKSKKLTVKDWGTKNWNKK